MKNKIIEEQLQKVEYADLSNYNKDTNTYVIKKRTDIKIEEDKCYLIYIKPSLFDNQALKVNWNKNNMPKSNYLKIDVSQKMGKMIKVVSVTYDMENEKDLGIFWSGWLQIDQIEIIKCI